MNSFRSHTREKLHVHWMNAKFKKRIKLHSLIMKLINDFRIEFRLLSRSSRAAGTRKDNYILPRTISLRDFLASFYETVPATEKPRVRRVQVL